MKMTHLNEERRAVLRIVAIYAFWGGLWIYLSDAILGMIVHDPFSMTILATYKGLLFIALTSSLLYFLIQRYVAFIREKTRQLKISEDRFQSIFHGISDAIFIHDAMTGKILNVNRMACDLFGYTSEEMMTMDVGSLSLGEPPYSQGEALAWLQLAVQGVAQKFQWKSKKSDGSIFWSEVSMRADVIGEDTCIIVSVRDITERKQIEETQLFLLQCGLPHTGEKFFESLARFLAETMKMEYVCIDRLSGDCLSAQTLAVYNEGHLEANIAYTLKDTPCGEVVGKQICCYSHNVCELFPDDPALQELQAESYAGVTLWSSKGNPIGLIAVIGRKPLSNANHAESILNLVALRAAGELERTVAEEILQKKEHQYRMLFENMTNGFALHEMIYDDDGRPLDYRFLEVNPEFEKQTGIPAATILGKTVKEVMPDTESYWIETYGNVARTGEPLSYQNYSKELDKYFDCWAFSPQKDHFAVIFSDITEKKQLEEQLRQVQKMEAIGQLAGGIAHDFNNILQVIIGYATILQTENRLDKQQHEEIDQILTSAKKAARLTNGLLAFSRRQVMSPKDVDLNNIVQNVQNLLLRIIGEDIRLQTKACEAPLPVRVDSMHIEQALINLATNARDSMPQGGTLTIETAIQHADAPLEHAHGYGEPGRYACITISDTGCGMGEETRTRIFEPFFTTKEVGKGTGLGMAIVYGIIKQHNGFINVCSEPGCGTTFRIYLPIIETGLQATDEGAVPLAPAGGSETILLAEDDASVRKLLVDVLKNFGYNLIQAKDGDEAVEKFIENQDRISLILMDMIMPKKNGMEAYEEISRRKPGTKVLYVSGYTADFIQNRGVSDAGIDLIMKPVQPAELLRKVRERLDS